MREISRTSVFSSIVGNNYTSEEPHVDIRNETGPRSNFKIPTLAKYDGWADFDFLEQCFFDINNFFGLIITHLRNRKCVRLKIS